MQFVTWDLVFKVIGGIALFIFTITLNVFLRKRLIREREQVQEVRQRIAQAEEKIATQPEKAKPAWDLARATLEAYFNRNLSQVSSIFRLSVVVMSMGFGVVVWGVVQGINHPDDIKPATIAAFSGIITEFIGATFLFIYRSTITQAVNYSRTLERINSVGMAMQILDTMPDETKADDLKSKTKAAIVELLIRQSYELQAVETAKEKPARKTAKPKTKG